MNVTIREEPKGVAGRKSRYKEAFAIFDYDCDGKISTGELGKAMRALGNPLTTKKLQNLVDVVDEKHDGCLDFEEFCHYMESWRSRVRTRDEILHVLSAFDTSGSGFVSSHFFSKFLQENGESPLTNREARDIIRLAAGDKHDFNYTDFVDLMLSHAEIPESSKNLSAAKSVKGSVSPRHGLRRGMSTFVLDMNAAREAVKDDS